MPQKMKPPTSAPAQAKAPVEERHLVLVKRIAANYDDSAQECAQLIANSEAEATAELKAEVERLKLANGNALIQLAEQSGQIGDLQAKLTAAEPTSPAQAKATVEEHEELATVSRKNAGDAGRVAIIFGVKEMTGQQIHDAAQLIASSEAEATAKLRAELMALTKTNGDLARLLDEPSLKLAAAESEIMRLQKKCIDSCIAWTDANDRATAAEARVQRLREALEILAAGDAPADRHSGESELGSSMRFAKAALAASAPLPAP